MFTRCYGGGEVNTNVNPASVAARRFPKTRDVAKCSNLARTALHLHLKELCSNLPFSLPLSLFDRNARAGTRSTAEEGRRGTSTPGASAQRQ